MGSRLRPVPDKIFECLIEVAAPVSENDGAKLVSFYPDNFEEEDGLKDVIMKFCFPFAHNAEMVDAVQHFAFVLTDIEGLFRFGFCRYPPKAKTCLCVLSDLPAFEMFYGILNTLAELENNAKNESTGITSRQFLDLVFESQVPEPGTKFTVSDPGTGWMGHYNYPDPGKLPSIPENRNLTDYFSAVNPNNMIALFGSMMFERRIIVTSRRLSLLTACTYSASLLLYPMYWQHVFIPVLPPSLLEYCSAPMPFLVGVHSSLMEKVRGMQLDGVVILDIDRQEIELIGDDLDDVDNLPSEAVSKLNNTLKKNTIAIGEYVARAFLSAIVVLIGGYRDALKLSSDTIVFEQDLFLTSRPHIKPFLEHLLNLQIFERFIHHRLQLLNSGEAIDDVFEEQVGLQTENDSKWGSQYKQWMKNRKRDGTQLLNSLSSKKEKATSKAKSFMHNNFKDMKEAMKRNKEKRKNLGDKEKEVSFYDNINGPAHRSNSLPMRKAFSVDPKTAARKSIGSVLQNHVDLSPQPKSPRPTRSAPGVPTNSTSKTPPRPPPPRPSNPPRQRPPQPAPYQPPQPPTSQSPQPAPDQAPQPAANRPPQPAPSQPQPVPAPDQSAPHRPPRPASSQPPQLVPASDQSAPHRPPQPGPSQPPPKSESNERKIRPSMVRNPGEPGVKDLINFYDSQEDLISTSSATNHSADPFMDFEEFDYLTDRNSPPALKINGLSSSDQNVNEGLLSQTMCSLSDDTRQFLRNSKFMESSESAEKCRKSDPSLNRERWDSPPFQRRQPVKKYHPGKKTLIEIAMEQKIGNGHVPSLAHASSAPSLLDPFESKNKDELYNSKSSSNANRNTNVELSQVGLQDSRTDNSDPFLELISERHKPQQNARQQNGSAWAAKFK